MTGCEFIVIQKGDENLERKSMKGGRLDERVVMRKVKGDKDNARALEQDVNILVC